MIKRSNQRSMLTLINHDITLAYRHSRHSRILSDIIGVNVTVEMLLDKGHCVSHIDTQ